MPGVSTPGKFLKSIMQKLIDTAQELSKKIGLPVGECIKILLTYQQNKILERISERLEPMEITRFIN